MAVERARQDAGEGVDASSAAIDRRVSYFGGAATHAAVTIDGKVTVYDGDYDYYLWKSGNGAQDGTKGEERPTPTPSVKPKVDGRTPRRVHQPQSDPVAAVDQNVQALLSQPADLFANPGCDDAKTHLVRYAQDIQTDSSPVELVDQLILDSRLDQEIGRAHV